MEKVIRVDVDIDGVLARHDRRRLFDHYNQFLELAIPLDQLEELSSLEDFHVLPQVQAYQAKVGKKRYAWQIDALAWHPRFVQQHTAVEGALEGMHYLASRAQVISYRTARFIAFDHQWNRELCCATQLWLKKQQFPNPSQVVCCDGVKAKLTTLAEDLKAQPDRHVVLIDDSAEKLLTVFYELSTDEQRVLVDHLTLVGFGYEQGQEVHHPLRTIPLESWSNVRQLEKEFSDAYSGKEQQQQQPTFFQ